MCRSGWGGSLASVFFSSRRRHTRYWRDWSSDVCSSDLHRLAGTAFNVQHFDTTVFARDGETVAIGGLIVKNDNKQENKIPWVGDLPYVGALRSEERRVGKECRSRWWPYH